MLKILFPLKIIYKFSNATNIWFFKIMSFNKLKFWAKKVVIKIAGIDLRTYTFKSKKKKKESDLIFEQGKKP